MSSERERGRELAREFRERGDPTGWFEELYASAGGDPEVIPWADLAPHPLLVDWLDRHDLDGAGKRGLVVGCGLGDDAEELAGRTGLAVTAFDISPTAIAWCRRRFPNSRVDYRVVDLFAPPATWERAFDFVLESYTLQALPPELHEPAMRQIAQFVGPDGTLLIIARGRESGEDEDRIPLPLTRAELDIFTSSGLSEVRFEDLQPVGDAASRHFRVEYRR